MSISFKRFIQIAGVIDKEEAKMLINCGIKFLGFPLRLPVHKEDLSEDEAMEIINSLPSSCHGVLITYLNETDDIINFCNKLGCSVVQLHGDISLNELSYLKTTRPDITVIKSLIVQRDNLNQLKEDVNKLSRYVNAFITDTYDPLTGASGATGKTHDWNVSKSLVEFSDKPVILAGGLNESNVYEAIKFVNPAGVDSHTGVEGAGGKKDESKIKKFVEEANRAFEEMN